MIQILLDLLLKLFQKQPPKIAEPATKEPPVLSIDWANPEAKIGKYFKVKDALYLPSWQIYHIPTEEEKANILAVVKIMDQIRELLGSPIIVSSWIRPVSVNCPGSEHHGKDYNAFKKGSKISAHRSGKAVDWLIRGVPCDALRAKLVPKLDELNIRMEDLPGSNWVHIDIDPPSKSGGKRFFPIK